MPWRGFSSSQEAIFLASQHYSGSLRPRTMIWSCDIYDHRLICKKAEAVLFAEILNRCLWIMIKWWLESGVPYLIYRRIDRIHSHYPSPQSSSLQLNSRPVWESICIICRIMIVFHLLENTCDKEGPKTSSSRTQCLYNSRLWWGSSMLTIVL